MASCCRCYKSYTPSCPSWLLTSGFLGCWWRAAEGPHLLLPCCLKMGICWNTRLAAILLLPWLMLQKVLNVCKNNIIFIITSNFGGCNDLLTHWFMFQYIPCCRLVPFGLFQENVWALLCCWLWIKRKKIKTAEVGEAQGGAYCICVDVASVTRSTCFNPWERTIVHGYTMIQSSHHPKLKDKSHY